jgi:hypothetical protein
MDMTHKMFDKMDKQIRAQSAGQRTLFSMSSLAPFTAIAGGVTAVFSAIISSVFPALEIWYLTRPAARAACLRESSKPKSPLPEVGVAPPW